MYVFASGFLGRLSTSLLEPLCRGRCECARIQDSSLEAGMACGDGSLAVAAGSRNGEIPPGAA